LVFAQAKMISVHATIIPAQVKPDFACAELILARVKVISAQAKMGLVCSKMTEYECFRKFSF
jgi:hypothetical protein